MRGCKLSLKTLLISDVSNRKVCAAQCQAGIHAVINGRTVGLVSSSLTYTHCHSVGWRWMNAETVPPEHCDHYSFTSTLQQFCIKFSRHLFPESIITLTLFIFNTPCGCGMKEGLMRPLVTALKPQIFQPKGFPHLALPIIRFEIIWAPDVSEWTKCVSVCICAVHVWVLLVRTLCVGVYVWFILSSVFWCFKPSVPTVTKPILAVNKKDWCLYLSFFFSVYGWHHEKKRRKITPHPGQTM